MKIMQSFLFMYYILDYCYWECKEDYLGIFLGEISPELLENGRPIDRAIYQDWKEQNNIKDLSEENIIEKTNKFISYYEGWCDVPETKKILSGLENDKALRDKVIGQAREYVEKMYRKHNYDD